ncbi:MAG: PSD1 and planctomycete cytochrome C domain-containing protein [Planctomycetaceae bacterium]
MPQHCLRIAILMVSVIVQTVGADDASQLAQVQRDAEELFVRRVLPVFQEKCFACHGDKPDDLKGAFDMRTRASLLRGGESGEAAILPGDAAGSPLYQAIRWESLEMPPKENDRLDDAQVASVRDWINAGAPWPSEDRLAELHKASRDADGAAGVPVVTSGGLTSAWTNRRYDPANLWAYRPLWQDESGRFFQSDRSPIDLLIEDRLREVGLRPAPLADRRTLIRRVTFDLTGLPPTPDEVDAFLNDPATEEVAFTRLIDRLLASPHYGEQWARHWLDVVRYADSSGFANDYERGNAWRYRDYVVRAFNDDKPFDEFIVEQIAGDELATQAVEQSEAVAAGERIIATGFLRMGPWELTGMEVPKVARQRFLDDVTDTVGQVFLAHMLQCARCHDHKFDPIPTQDYYAMQAVFATTQLAEREAAFLPVENVSGFEERKYLEQRRKHYEQLLAGLAKKQTLDAARDWYRSEGKDAALFEATVENLREESGANKFPDIAAVRKQMQQQAVDPALIPPKHVGFAPEDFGLERVARKGLERLEWRMERYEPFALGVYSGRTPNLKSVYRPLRIPSNRLEQGVLEETCILTGGDPFSPGEPVSPGVLSVVTALSHPQSQDSNPLASLESPDVITGRRLALARWIASPDNPLTARVMVNRLWQWHFGEGLAGNPNNFGATGKRPTHPELLDWLAATFIEEGWSIKAMHRRILLSETYRRSSRHPDPAMLDQLDPLRQTYAVFRPRRIDAEELRDALLSVTGELNPTIGGVPVRPEMNREAAMQPRMVMGTFAEAWQPSPLPAQRHRRSLYALRLRGQRDPFFEVFNVPAPDLCTEARESSTVTPQVFALFNSEIAYDRAIALANRLLIEADRPIDRGAVIARGIQRLYGRDATDAELAACVEHWERMETRHAALRFATPTYPDEIVRDAVEENTGEKFRFTEPLELAAEFVRDLKPADVDASTRGLAEVCLVLMNANEFAYVE